MKKAIVTGSTGLIASGLVECLLDNNIEVLALGRKPVEDTRIAHLTNHPNLKYLSLEMSEIESLPKQLEEMNWSPGEECVFYHFAWSGTNRLTDGSVQDQFKNVSYASKAVLVAKELACKKFINAGSQEEKFVDKYLESHWTQKGYHSNTYLYGSAKVSARDMCLLLAYLHKIDYVHTRISVVFEESLETNNYINSVLKKILNKEKFDAPSNTQLFDFISKEECAKSYYLLGESGKNKSDYLLATGNPMTLQQFFSDFSLKANGEKMETSEVLTPDNWVLNKEDFTITDLINDTGFRPNSPKFNYKQQ